MSQESLSDLLGSSARNYAINNKKEHIPISSLSSKDVVGLYFSAHWCSPCKLFTPELVDVYKKVAETGKKFEIVFISFDRDEEAFDDYFSEMPWLAIPHSDKETQKKTAEKYEVSGIPALILLDGTGNLLTKDGRKTVTKDKLEFINKEWHIPSKEKG